MKKPSVLPLTVSFLLCLGAGAVSDTMTFVSGGWYRTLTKPVFGLPNEWFRIVWAGMYLPLAAALYTVWTTPANKKYKAVSIIIFCLMLYFNSLWAVIFFGMRNPAAALVGVSLLLAVSFATIRRFEVISQTGGYLLVPYLVWVTITGVLNLAIVILN